MKMKKIFYFVAALALFACEKADLIDQPAQGGIASGADLPEVIYATVDRESDDATTRTYADGKSILWHGGDAITYIGHDAFRAKYQYDGEDGVSSASFTYKETGNVPTGAVKPEIPFAVYPYGSGAYCKQVDGVNTLVVNFPAEQTYAENSFGRGANVMVGVGATADDTDFYFRNACGYLVIKLLGDDVSVKSIELTALGGEGLSGTGYISASRDAAPVVTMDGSAKSTVTLNCGDGVVLNATTATEFWFALPPVTFSEGFKMFVTLTQGAAFEMQTSKRVDIVRNDIQPMAELQYAPNAQAPNQLFYTRSDNSTDPIAFYNGITKPFDANIVSHYYNTQINQLVIECDAPIKVIKEYSFSSLAISSISLPSQLETIEFSGLYGIGVKELKIPGSVTLVGVGALGGMTSLTDLYFLEGEKDLEIRFLDDEYDEYYMGPFDNSPLTYVYINRNIDYRDSEGGSRDYKRKGSSRGLFATNRTVDRVDVEFGPKATGVPPMTFADLNLVEITIPGTMRYIGYNAFMYCKKLAKVDIEESNNALTLGYQYFSSSEYGPFYDSPLANITLKRNIHYVNDKGNVFTPDSWNEGLFANKEYSSVNEVSVTLGGSLTTIPSYTFNYLNITKITIPAKVIEIGYNVFKNCTKLATVNIEEGTETLTLGNQLHNSAWWATFYDSPLTSVTCKREIDYRASDGSVYPLNEWGDGVFASKCSNLTSISLGGGLRNILPYMFGKAKVSGVWIPHTIESIGDKAFYDCDNLSGLTLGYDGTTKFPSIGEGVFSGCSKSSDIFIKVREGVYESFMDKANNNELGWGAYKNKIITGSYN